MTPLSSLDDLRPGQEFDLGTFSLPRAEVLAFASRYDPQYFHLDEAAAKDSLFGGLVASGLHTLSATVGQLVRSGLISNINLAGSDMTIAWPAPLAPEEEVRFLLRVEEVRPSRSKPEMGIAKLRYRVSKVADDTLVLDVLCTHFMRR
ncbi:MULTISPECIES: MaoC/PaaZ C-terminal domain-containing protein [Roseomonadaceae]|uniref:Dehydratase n=1 Tax=Falsiroseomonas oleicola TaxID=2801474 RepID=A0ABS6H0L0_9PROT|nr:MaoC/PaaZ C-terminal domain-containing protein [Roseomonas oleicola]MBU8542208.1 dehydratase [Roseomonas oleicola]